LLPVASSPQAKLAVQRQLPPAQFRATQSDPDAAQSPYRSSFRRSTSMFGPVDMPRVPTQLSHSDSPLAQESPTQESCSSDLCRPQPIPAPLEPIYCRAMAMLDSSSGPPRLPPDPSAECRY